MAGYPSSPQPRPSTEVYAIFGVEPEIQAYAMAKYSRSNLSMKESLREISAQRAEKFLNTFYFQYGHRSIADLAHIAFAIERLSLLAAIAVVDEQRWDGQERSTRYQDFSHPDYYVPDFAGEFPNGNAERECYISAIEFLFGEYRRLSAAMFEHLRAGTPCPAEMKKEQYERTLRARAFDISRYLLPLATCTSLGQIVNARTLETQIARLLSSRNPELRELAGKLKEAARTAAYDVNAAAKRELYDRLGGDDLPQSTQVHDLLMKPVLPAPTLVKYAEANAYLLKSRRELECAARELMQSAAIADAPPVDLLDDEPLEVELAATLLYEHCHYPYRQIRERVEGLSAARRQEVIALGANHRGRHDELLRAYTCGLKFRFDILMDIGGFRDMHRHRRCIQIGQEFTMAHEFDTPPDVISGGWKNRYDAAMAHAREAASKLTSLSESNAQNNAGGPAPGTDGSSRNMNMAPQAAGNGDETYAAEPVAPAYLIPLAFRKRTLFKMDLAEAVYISELRTTPAGHFSYRQIAWQMYEAVKQRHPEFAILFRVQDPHEPLDLLQR